MTRKKHLDITHRQFINEITNLWQSCVGVLYSKKQTDDLYEPSYIVKFALKDVLCITQHACHHPLSSYSLEQSDSRNSSTSTWLLIGRNVVLATWRTGDGVGGSLEELLWACVKSDVSLNNTLWIVFCLAVGKIFCCNGSPNSSL